MHSHSLVESALMQCSLNVATENAPRLNRHRSSVPKLAVPPSFRNWVEVTCCDQYLTALLARKICPILLLLNVLLAQVRLVDLLCWTISSQSILQMLCITITRVSSTSPCMEKEIIRSLHLREGDENSIPPTLHEIGTWQVSC